MSCRLSVVLVVLGLLLAAPAAHAAGSPDISLGQSPATVLYGDDQRVELTAANPAGPTWGYNLTYRAVLPVGVSYAGGGPVAPRQLADKPAAGQTTLIFENVADLSGGSSHQLGFDVALDPSLDPGTTFTISSGAYVNSDAHYLPKFDANGQPIAGATSYTGSATASALTTVTAIDLRQEEPSPEGELLRGAHDHRTVYRLFVENNGIDPTTGAVVDAYLPAGLEYLGCGVAGADNTTDAPTNPGADEEYPGSGPLNASSFPGLASCLAPSLVETVQTDPDGAGPRPNAVYTHLRYALGALAATQIDTIEFVAAIPLRENTLDWGGATPAGPAQAANLDNNGGAETSDEQSLSVYSTASGLYDGTLPVSDTDTITRTAEDLRVLKSADESVISQGLVTTWTLDIDASEYRYVENVTVADTLPDGLCPLDDGVNYEGTAECLGGSGDQPSLPYDGAPTENVDGSWDLAWALPSRLDRSSRYTITYKTRTRANYQENFIDALPVFGRDSWTNSVSVSGDDYRICANGDNACTGLAIKIDGDETDGIADDDVSSEDQSAGGPSIDKQVQATSPARVDCKVGAYSDTPPGPFAPGDKVCYRLRVTFPQDLDFRNTAVTDFLPVGMTYVPGSAEVTPASTVSATIDDSDAHVVTFELASGDVDAQPGQVFEAVVAAKVDLSATTHDGDITGNLMKLVHANTSGSTFPLRDELDTELTQPEIALRTGVRTVNADSTRPVNTDNVTVPGAATVQYRVDVENTGGLEAANVEVWSRLPQSAGAPTCATVSAISDGGACLTGPDGDYIRWVVPSLAANSTIAGNTQKTLTYTTTHGDDLTGNQNLITTAGVRQFESDANDGNPVTWTPATNIDPANLTTPNATAASDPTNVRLRNFTVTGAITSAVNETGNNAVSGTTAQATIGETVTYTGTLTVPEGTTFSNPVFRIPVSARLDGVANVTATFNGGALPPGWSVAYAGGYVVLSAPATTYVNDDDGDGNHAEDDSFQVSFDAVVAQAPANTRAAANIAGVWGLTYDDVDATPRTGPSSASLEVRIVEPAITTTIIAPADGATVKPGDDVTYTVRTANGSATGQSIAHETVTTVTVPAGLTPYASGSPVADGGTVGGGTWNLGTRTITFADGDIAPGANQSHTFVLRVDSPAVAGSLLTVDAEGRTSSHPGAAPSERTAVTTPNAGYISAASVDVELAGASIAKGADRITATVGEQATYTLDVTLQPGLTYHDVTVRDTLPAKLVYDGMVDAVCTSGCSDPDDIAVTALPQSGQVTGYFLGEIPQAGAARVVRIRYRAHVGPTGVEGNTLVNSAVVYDNATDVIVGTPGAIPAAAGFDQASAASTHTVTVHEPVTAIAKTVSGTATATRIAPGDTATYTVAVTNNGQSPLYDVHVTDTPDSDLTAVTATTGAGFVTAAWAAAGDTIAWDIPGPIAAGATVSLAYTAELAASGTLQQAEAVDNTATITAGYGLPASVRSAQPGFTYINYAPRAASRNLTTGMPRVTVTQTTGAGGFPESAPAEVGQPFTWRVVLTNTSVATAHDLTATDVLPPDWTYTAGTATLDGVATANPTITGQTLTWQDLVSSLAPGASAVLTFQAVPQPDARVSGGVGAGNPHVADAAVDWEDATGATADADGAYHAGDDPAQAVLAVPTLDVQKTPDALTVDSGADQPFTIVVTNTGSVRARNLVVEDVLPAGLSYTAGTATSSGADAGFAETDGTGPQLAWTADGLDAGQQLTITLPVRVAPSVDAATALVNTASAVSDERPDGASDTGTITTDTHVDLELAKSGPAAAKAGEVITWTLEAVNHGPSDARDAQIVDTLPAEVTFVDAAAGCAHAAGTVTCALGTLVPGQHVTRTVRTRIDPGALAVSILNHAELTSSVDETNGANNVAEATVATGNAVDLELTKTAAAPTVVETLDATWKLHVVNKGPSDAYDVELVDTLPAGMTLISATPDQGACAVAAPVVTCELGRIDEGQDADVTVIARGDVVGPHTNAAQVTTDLNTELDPSDNAADSTVTVVPAADLAIAKTGPGEVPAGGKATYTLTARNDGRSAASSVQIVDELPAGTAFVAATDGCVATGQTVTCAVGGLAVGESAQRTVTLRVGDELGSQVIQNVARVSGAEADLDLADNTALADTKVGPAADLRIVKRSTQLYASGDVTYVLDVFNDGPSDAAQVAVADTLPAGLRFRRAVSTQGACTAAGQDVTCALGDMANGAAAAIQITATADALPAGATVENVATVSGAVLDPTPENNSARVSGIVAGGAAPRHDLALTKTASAAEPTLGERFTYTIAVRNNGPDTARNVTLTDPVPAGLEIGAVTPRHGTCAADRQLLRCALGSIRAGAKTTVAIVATPVRTGRFRNSALVAADGTDTKVSNNGGVAGVNVVSGRVRLGVTKRAARRTVDGGATMRYVISVRARGGAARDVRVCDRLPDGMVFAKARGARFSGGHACWTVKLLRKGAVRRYTLMARAEVGARGKLVNRAIGTSPGARRRTARAAVVARPNQGVRGGGVTG